MKTNYQFTQDCVLIGEPYIEDNMEGLDIRIFVHIAELSLIHQNKDISIIWQDLLFWSRLDCHKTFGSVDIK